MAFWSNWFTPVELPPDEKVFIRKRESLRSRGIAWLIGLGWLFSLLVIEITLLAVKAGAKETAITWVNAVLLILMVFALPGTLAVFLKWYSRTCLVNQNTIKLDDNLGAKLFKVPMVEFDLRQIDKITVQKPALSGRLFNLGDLVISTRRRPAALVISGVEHPYYKVEEIRKRVKEAHIRARTGQAGADDELLPTLKIRGSGAWLVLKWLPVAFVGWGAVLAWFTLRLFDISLAPVGLRITGFIGIISLIVLIPWWCVSFLRWWIRIYVITDRRVIQREGILNITRRVLSLDDVTTATAMKAGLGRFLDVGHVQIMTAGLTGDIIMENISDPDYVRQRVLEIQEMEKRRRQQLELSEITKKLQATLRL